MKHSIPENTFPFEYDSEQWNEAYRIFIKEYNLPEYKEARAKARHEGRNKFPANSYFYRYHKAIQETEKLLKVSFRNLQKLVSQNSLNERETLQAKVYTEDVSRHKKHLKYYKFKLGELVSDSLAQGLKVSEDLKIIEEMLPNIKETLSNMFELYPVDLKNEPIELKPRILKALEELRLEWFGLTFSSWMVTKASLRNNVFTEDPTDDQKKQFTRIINELGLSKLPQAKRGRKKK